MFRTSSASLDGVGMLNLEVKFPALSELAKLNKCSLETLAVSAKIHPGYITFSDACQIARDQHGSWSHADTKDYLGTLDLFLAKHPMSTKTRRTFWRRLYAGSGSQFLDIICEAAWGLYFVHLDINFIYEAPLNPRRRGGRNADFRIDRPEGPFWLDVVSGEVERPDQPRRYHSFAGSAFSPYSRETTVAIASQKAAAKYRAKFESALHTGSLRGDSVGVLLGFSKMEKQLLPGLMVDLLTHNPAPPPSGLFGHGHPGLIVAWGFTLARAKAGTHLVPSLIFPWTHPAQVNDPFLNSIRPDLIFIQERILS